MNASSSPQKPRTQETAQTPLPKEALTDEATPGDTLLGIIRKTELTSEEFSKVIGELYAHYEQGRINTYLQESQILGHLKDSDAVRTTYGYYGIQRHSTYGGDDELASGTYFYTIKNPVTGTCTCLEAVYKLFRIEGLGGKNINNQYENSLDLKFGEVRGEAFCYEFHNGGPIFTEWSHGGVRDILLMLAAELGLLRIGNEKVVKELLDLFWGHWPNLWDDAADLAYQDDNRFLPSLGMVILKELEARNDSW
jgi:hypothetical protein